jgi:hypothetical protein
MIKTRVEQEEKADRVLAHAGLVLGEHGEGRALRAIRSRDYFPPPERAEAEQAVEELASLVVAGRRGGRRDRAVTSTARRARG